MNTKQINALQAMDIVTWLSNKRVLNEAMKPTSRGDEILYYCLVDELEFKQASQKALFAKMIEALGWSRAEIKLISKQRMHAKSIPAENQKPVFVFGESTDVELLKSIPLPSLSAMLQDPQAKRLAWVKLKDYKK